MAVGTVGQPLRRRMRRQKIGHTSYSTQLFYHTRAYPINSDSSSSSNDDGRVALRRRVTSRIP
jgi:hypothetical protein